jgi:hypothetical protein
VIADRDLSKLRRVLRRGLLSIAVLAAIALVPTEALGKAPMESYGTVLSQIDSGVVIRGVVNAGPRHVEVLLRSRAEYLAVYPPGAEPALLSALHAHHVKVEFARRAPARAEAKPVHHHLRYIAAGVLAALLMVGGGVLLLRRRRPAGADA